jgi:hypothetical protein
MNVVRVRHLIESALRTFELDLQGLCVLTEAASGYYVLTPMIAALGGAERVYALARDSCYGPVKKILRDTLDLASCWGVSDRIEVLESRTDQRIEQADVVTNLGFVRPLNAEFLRRLKPAAVIPLMWEAWEYRREDLDLARCRGLGIPVLGTNEHHPHLRTFEYIGPLVVKLLFCLDIEVFLSRIVVVGSGEFADIATTALLSLGAKVISIDSGSEGALRSRPCQEALRAADAMVVVESHQRKTLIGAQGEMTAEILHTLNPNLVVAHVCGGVDRDSLESMGLRCIPDRFAPAGHMSVATDYLGPKPLIELHTAGLKVGELMWKRKRVLGDARQVEAQLANECSFCQVLPETE